MTSAEAPQALGPTSLAVVVLNIEHKLYQAAFCSFTKQLIISPSPLPLLSAPTSTSPAIPDLASLHFRHSSSTFYIPDKLLELVCNQFCVSNVYLLLSSCCCCCCSSVLLVVFLHCAGVWHERDRDSQRERETDRERDPQRHTERQTDRLTERQRDSGSLNKCKQKYSLFGVKTSQSQRSNQNEERKRELRRG